VIKIVPLSLKQGGDVMSEGAISIKKAIPIIVITWILSLVTTLAIAYFTPFIPIEKDQIGDGAVTADKILDGAIITTKLDDGTVTSAKILDATITAEDIASGSIITVKVADEAITTTKIADDSITTAKIADGAIVTVKLADDAVTTSKIVDNAIVTVKMADGSVTSAKILDGTIVAADLATGAVTSIKIADGAVTTSKIADYAVTDIKLAAGAIPFNSTYSTVSTSTTSTSWVDMPGMSVGLTLDRNSSVIIMFSSEAYLTAGGDYLLVQALVNSTIAYPGTGALITLTTVTATNAGSYSYIFSLPNVGAGYYTVKIQWLSWTGTMGYVEDRTLTVMALPA
jgi:hypothetical protein